MSAQTVWIFRLYDLGCFAKKGEAMRKVLLEIVHDPKTVVAVASMILAFIGVLLGPLVQLRIGSKQAAAAQRAVDLTGSTAIATMRLEWMDKLRDTLSEFHSILMIKENVDKEKDAVKLSHLGTEIDLLLNRDDKIQRELWDITDKIYKCEAIEERQEMDEELVSAGRAALKSEWEKVKAEMRGEAFNGRAHSKINVAQSVVMEGMECWIAQFTSLKRSSTVIR
jgi:hypothetical protein